MVRASFKFVADVDESRNRLGVQQLTVNNKHH